MESGKFYHYFNRANNRENLFVEEDNYRFFLQLLKKHIVPIAAIYSYCLLPNHFHLVIKTKEDEELPEEIQNKTRKLSQPFSNLFNAYAKEFNKSYKRRGSLFQKHPKHIEIDNNTYLQEVILYVNNNAGHHNISDPLHYAHSSYHSLLSNSKTLLARNRVIEFFGSMAEFEECLEDKTRRIELAQSVLLEDED
jgi:REP element-mobilizing transposase RayT